MFIIDSKKHEKERFLFCETAYCFPIDTLRHEGTIQSSALKKNSEITVLEQKLFTF